MAEASHRGESSTRRQSFRKSLADAALPQEYLDLLEQKRKQLDESIHKYIAAKERDYKTYEKDLRVQYRQAQGGSNEKESITAKARRTSSESTGRDASSSPQIRAQQKSVVDALLAQGLSRQQIGQPLAIAVVEQDGSSVLEAKSAAGLVDRRASFEREKEFVGVFTPAYLPALGDEVAVGEEDDQRAPTQSNRPGSAPPMGGQSRPEDGAEAQDTMQRANSDPLVQAKAKRPVHLQLAHRTSSSGSSADGRLTSALKSPTGSRPKRKRVSLAVGDSIVKPSDNVPFSMLNNNHTPSHSRTRSSSSRRDKTASIDAQIADGTNGVKETASPPEEVTTTNAVPPPTTTTPTKKDETTPAIPATPVSIPSSTITPPSPPTADPTRNKIDPDGDLFDLVEDEDEDEQQSRSLSPDLDEPVVTGRVAESGPQPPSSSTHDQQEDSSSQSASPTADHIEFQAGTPSSYSSRQPLNPGFRRPSANMDPVYRGPDYEKAERNVVAEEIYGSRYDRPGGAGASFTSGSLGESFMQRNAELMRARQVRS